MANVSFTEDREAGEWRTGYIIFSGCPGPAEASRPASVCCGKFEYDRFSDD
ncbi:hypothetical protein SAMN05518801_11025 [Novosphingobium sp. CF614]|nr:hypothetical protein SAMN05518801_11025 [Novosphingobium sp. CF614]